MPNETSTEGKSPAGSNTTPLQNSGFTHDAAEEEIQAHLARLRRQDPSITEQTEVLSSESLDCSMWSLAAGGCLASSC